MKILLSNDDGYQAPGLAALRTALEPLAQLSVVAPDRNRSGASNSLTLDNPIRAHTEPDGVVRVDGTPTDCVHLAITGLLEEEPDMVIAGINAGGNMGDDVLYSGTVAAATEGRFLGLPAIAISLASMESLDFSAAAEVAVDLVNRLKTHPLPSDTILNVNVPPVKPGDLKGVRITRLGARHKSEPVIRSTDPRGLPLYWVGPAGSAQDSGPDTDFHAVANGFVSITPLQIDLTRYNTMDDLTQWLNKPL